MSAKTYRMPPLAGEMTAHHQRADPPSAGFYVDGEVIWVPLALLTEVVPPLPEEYPIGSVVRADFRPKDRADVESWVFEHAEIAAPNGNDWYGAGRDEAFSWAEVCALGTPVRLIPEPVVEPVTLPWKAPNLYGDEARVEPSVNDGYVFVNGGHLTPDTADAMAAALTTAAAKARQS